MTPAAPYLSFSRALLLAALATERERLRRAEALLATETDPYEQSESRLLCTLTRGLIDDMEARLAELDAAQSGT